jgi:hypothetical protein
MPLLRSIEFWACGRCRERGVRDAMQLIKIRLRYLQLTHIRLLQPDIPT